MLLGLQMNLIQFEPNIFGLAALRRLNLRLGLGQPARWTGRGDHRGEARPYE